jgi:hypothetical protein
MKPFLGSSGIALPILNLSVRWRWVISIAPRMLCLRERTPVLTEWEAGWARRLTRRFGRREIFSIGIWTPDRSVHCLVCIPNTLSWLKVSHRIVRRISLFEIFQWNPFFFFWQIPWNSVVKNAAMHSHWICLASRPLSAPCLSPIFGSSSDSRTRQYYSSSSNSLFLLRDFHARLFLFATAADLIPQVAPSKVNYVFCNNFRE